jgi:hypothetical protein
MTSRKIAGSKANTDAKLCNLVAPFSRASVWASTSLPKLRVRMAGTLTCSLRKRKTRFTLRIPPTDVPEAISPFILTPQGRSSADAARASIYAASHAGTRSGDPIGAPP